MNEQCKIVEDLLPLYHDGICSEESRQLVEEHLSQCEPCRRLLNQIGGELVSPASKDADMKPLVGINKAVKKGKKKALITGISIALAVVLVLFAGVSIWWYTQEYSYYTSFAENHTPHSIYELREDGSIIQSFVDDANMYTWYDDTYRYDVIVPSFLSSDGDVDMSALNGTEDQWISVGVSQWNDVEYAFHVSINRDGGDHYFIVDSELNQYYLDHWTEDMIARQNADFAEHKEEIRVLVTDAMAMWPFIQKVS